MRARWQPLQVPLSIAALVVLTAAAQTWPNCQEHGQVFRHNGKNGIFIDLVPVGAKEGCWQNDCTKTDKFVCPSPEACAEACLQVDLCKYWTYEPGIRKCFMRSSDADRENHPDFVSGSRECRPSSRGLDGTGKAVTEVWVPFAAAAIWAAELPALRACDGGLGSPGCGNPYAAMGTWRYAVNNLRMAVSLLPEAELRQHASTVQYVQQIVSDVANFFHQPTAESLQVAISNTRAVFEALGGWLRSAAPSQMILQGDDSRQTSSEDPGGQTHVVLADGHTMPLLGFGTWQLLGQQAYDATLTALQVGYRHIDTAQAYMNEREIGMAIRDSGLPRGELFIATKISDPDEFAVLEQRLDQQLASLGTQYLDLYMLHSPGERAGRERAWRIMEEMQTRGKVKSLGVSNFGVAELQELLDFARIKPVYVQNKFSIYNPGEQQLGSTPLLMFAKQHSIQVMGYSVINPWPFMLPPLEDPHVRAVAARCGRSEAQVLHRWALQQGIAVIPKSATAARIQENARLFDFKLSELDMKLLSGVVTLSESNAGSVKPAWADDVYSLGSSAI